MSNVNADATQLLTILKNMRTSISSIETILDTKFIISQIGKQCKPVQVHSFSRFSPSVQSSQICLLREHPQFPLNGICDTGYSFILNVFLKKKKLDYHLASRLKS